MIIGGFLQLPGVDPNDPSVKDLLASMQNQSEVSLSMEKRILGFERNFFQNCSTSHCWSLWPTLTLNTFPLSPPLNYFFVPKTTTNKCIAKMRPRHDWPSPLTFCFLYDK